MYKPQIIQINKDLQINMNKIKNNGTEQKIINLFEKYFPNSLEKISSTLYQFTIIHINLYFWYKKDERWSFKSIFQNSDNNLLFRWWVDYASKLKSKFNDDNIVNNFFLIFTKDYYPLFMIFKEELFSNFIKEINLPVTLQFFNSELSTNFYICLLEDFILTLRRSF